MQILAIHMDDLEAIAALMRDVSEVDVVPHFNEQGKMAYRARVLSDIQKIFDPASFNTVKLISEGVLVGFAALREGNYLTHLFVAKEMQGKGAGKLLLDYVLKGTDAKEISLRSSINVVSFYQAFGFETTDTESDFNGIRFVPMRLIKG